MFLMYFNDYSSINNGSLCQQGVGGIDIIKPSKHHDFFAYIPKHVHFNINVGRFIVVNDNQKFLVYNAEKILKLPKFTIIYKQPPMIQYRQKDRDRQDI